jgi:hypothetical protein
MPKKPRTDLSGSALDLAKKDGLDKSSILGKRRRSEKEEEDSRRRAERSSSSEVEPEPKRRKLTEEIVE